MGWLQDSFAKPMLALSALGETDSNILNTSVGTAQRGGQARGCHRRPDETEDRGSKHIDTKSGPACALLKSFNRIVDHVSLLNCQILVAFPVVGGNLCGLVEDDRCRSPTYIHIQESL